MSAAVGSDPIRAQAAQWFARAHSGEWDDTAQAERDAWLAADPRHAYEYRVLESIWQAAADIPQERLQALATVRPRRFGVNRRQAIAAFCTGVLVLGLAIWHWPRGVIEMEYRTALGERQTVTLSDGSVVELNSGSHIQVRFDETTRRVKLLAGQALFSVEKDAKHPFLVDAGIGTALVTGTRFDVRRDTDQLSVVVESGSVNVEGRDDTEPVAVVAGNAVRIGANGRAESPQHVDVATELSWRKGQIVFRETDLASAAREVSRYRQQPVVLAGQPSLGKLQVSGVFRTDDTDAFLAALPHFLPVQVRQLADGRREIVSAAAVTK